MGEHTSRQVLTDDQLRDIIVHRKKEPAAVLAAEYGVCDRVVRAARKFNSFRALRIAKELGVI